MKEPDSFIIPEVAFHRFFGMVGPFRNRRDDVAFQEEPYDFFFVSMSATDELNIPPGGELTAVKGIVFSGVNTGGVFVDPQEGVSPKIVRKCTVR